MTPLRIYSDLTENNWMDFFKKIRGGNAPSYATKGAVASSANPGLRVECNVALRASASSWASVRPIRVMSMTYNVASENPPTEEYLAQWFRWQTKSEEGAPLFGDVDVISDSPSAPPLPEVIFVGLQEVDMSTRSILLEASSERCRAWVAALCGAVSQWAGPGGYRLVISDQLVGLATLLWIRTDALASGMWADIRACRVRFGAGGLLGNKGAIGIRLCMYGRTLLLLNCHFVPDPGNHDKRCVNFHSVFAGLDFPARDVARAATSSNSQRSAADAEAVAASLQQRTAQQLQALQSPGLPGLGGIASPLMSPMSPGSWSPTKGTASTYVHHLPHVDTAWRALRPGADMSGLPSVLATACDGPSHCIGAACRICGGMSAATASAPPAQPAAAQAADSADIRGSSALTTAVASAYDYVLLIGDINVRLDTTDTARVQTALSASPPAIDELASLDQLRMALKSGAMFCIKAPDARARSGSTLTSSSPMISATASHSRMSFAGALAAADSGAAHFDTPAVGPPAGQQEFTCGDPIAVAALLPNVDPDALAEAAAAAAAVTPLASPLSMVAFMEPPLLFRPGYKYLQRSREYDFSSKKNVPRIPSWTDRILILAKNSTATMDGDQPPTPELAPAAVCVSYRCVHDTITSDHRPVIAQFVLGGIEVDHSAVLRALRDVALRREGSVGLGLIPPGRGEPAPHVCRDRHHD